MIWFFNHWVPPPYTLVPCCLWTLQSIYRQVEQLPWLTWFTLSCPRDLCNPALWGLGSVPKLSHCWKHSSTCSFWTQSTADPVAFWSTAVGTARKRGERPHSKLMRLFGIRHHSDLAWSRIPAVYSKSVEHYIQFYVPWAVFSSMLVCLLRPGPFAQTA